MKILRGGSFQLKNWQHQLKRLFFKKMKSNLHKYARVNELVCQITTNKSLQTFFILYLMAEDEAQKNKLNQDFKEAWQQLPLAELDNFKQDFTASLKKLLPLAKELLKEVSTYKTELSQTRLAA